MDINQTPCAPFKTAIEPWLNISGGEASVLFYKNAFDATETYRMEDPGGGLVVKLSVEGAGFWISSDGDIDNPAFVPMGAETIRMILVVADPDKIFAQAMEAGAAEISPVSEDYGWKMGRMVDPFGHHWEIGRPL